MKVHKTKLFEIANSMKLLIGYDVNTEKHPIRIEEFHGKYQFNEDEITINLTSVELIIDVLSLLSQKETNSIIDSLNDE